MDNDKFLELLSRVATWEIPDVTRGGNIKENKSPRVGRPTKEQQYQEQHEKEFLDLFGGKNPTLSPLITEIKVEGCHCDDCGKYCEQGRHKETIKYTTNRPHWRNRCTTCGLNQNPYTGAWDLTNKDAAAVWSNWLRKTSEKPYAYKKKQKDGDENVE